MTSREHEALILCRDALQVAASHLRSHPGYSIKVAKAIETAMREAERVMETTKVPA